MPQGATLARMAASHRSNVLANGLGVLQHVCGRVQQLALHQADVPKDSCQQAVKAWVLACAGAKGQG